MSRHIPQGLRFAGTSNDRSLDRLKAVGWTFAGGSRRDPRTGTTIWLVVGTRDGDFIQAAGATAAVAWARAIVLATCHRPAVSRTA